MTDDDTIEVNKFVANLKRQFLCCYPVKYINWEAFPKILTWEQQQQLITSTYNHLLNQKYPIKLAYQLNFLKRLIQQLELFSDEVHDCIYESYCAVQQSLPQDTTQKYAYKHYLLSQDADEDVVFTLKESKSFVADGTTGLCSWQASIALADYLLQHEDVVRDNCVLELGAGTGLCGFILLRCCGARKVLLTDGSLECVELMRENFKINFSNTTKVRNGCYQWRHQSISMEKASWETIESCSALKDFQSNIILAADVVYDDTVFEALTHAIDWAFRSMDNKCQMFLAATVRNERTLQTFLTLLGKNNFIVKDQPLSSEHKLYWDHSTLIKILKITRDV